MFSICELLVARPLISPRLLNWEDRYSGTRAANKREQFDYCRKRPSQLSSGKILWKRLRVKQQSGIQYLALNGALSLSFIGTIINS